MGSAANGYLSVVVPTGLGDVHWACTKLRALSARHANMPLRVSVNKDRLHPRTADYLQLVPFIAEAETVSDAPVEYGSWFHDHQFSRLATCQNWGRWDYAFFPNGHLERGDSLASWLPELETEYQYPLLIDPAVVARMRAAMEGPGAILLHTSGPETNQNFHGGKFRQENWLRIFDTACALSGRRVGILGGPVDRHYALPLLDYGRHRGAIDLVGYTTHAELCALLKDAALLVSITCGVVMVAAMQGIPTLAFWPDARYRVGPAAGTHHPNMQTSWLNAEQRRTYRSLSFGSPEWTLENILGTMEELYALRRRV
jgi:hypothetical protein